MPEGVNRVILNACLAQAKALRYTPAGLPALDLTLDHESQVTEAGQVRNVRVSVRAKALGAVAETLGHQAIGSVWMFTGFLATPLNGKHPVFHIQEFQPV